MLSPMPDRERPVNPPRFGRDIRPDALSEPPPHLIPDERPSRHRMAVLGGSFDPVHNGHLFVAGEILRQDVADEVLFVPAACPPHKQGTSLSSPEHRMAMVRLAIEPYPAFCVSDIELTRPVDVCFTIETLELLGTAFPDHALRFVIGMDSLLELHTWHRASELVSRHAFVVLPRPGYPAPKRTALSERFGARNANRLIDSILEAASVPISATQIRAAVAHGTLAGLVPQPVEEYIREHTLYEPVDNGASAE